MLDLILATVMGFPDLLLANSSAGLADQVRNFVGPLALIACSIFALVFLVQRQFMQMLMFVVIAVIVFAIFYAPEMIANLGRDMGQTNSNLSWN